jgi:hypothetical protein
MTISLVDTSGTRIDHLDPFVTKAVKDYFAGDSECMTEAETDAALNIFDRMKERGWRLACDCADGPLLSAANPAVLKRMPPPNPAHADTCVFHTRVRRIIHVSPNRDDLGGDLSVHDEFHDRAGTSAHRGGTATGATTRRSGLSKVLFKLLDAAGANSISASSYGEQGPSAKNIWYSSGKVTLSSDGRTSVNLRDLLVVEPVQFKAITRLNELKKKIASWEGWPSRSRPHGFYCGVVTNYEYLADRDCYALHMSGWKSPQYIDGSPQIFAEADAAERGPYIAIVSFAQQSRQDSQVRGLRCYMQPCLSADNWFPVDSGSERRTLELLFRFKLNLRDAQRGIDVTISKPLFNVKDDRTGAVCRPDFVITATKHGAPIGDIAIETMGMSGDTYEESKRRTHPIMQRRYGLLIQHQTHGSGSRQQAENDARFLKELWDSIESRHQPNYPSLS